MEAPNRPHEGIFGEDMRGRSRFSPAAAAEAAAEAAEEAAADAACTPTWPVSGYTSVSFLSTLEGRIFH